MAKTRKYEKTLFPKADLDRIFAENRGQKGRIAFLHNVVDLGCQDREKLAKECLNLEEMNRGLANRVVEQNAKLASMEIDVRLREDRHARELQDEKRSTMLLTSALWLIIWLCVGVFL